MPERLKKLEAWLADQCGLQNFDIEPASGDASFRRYFRLSYENLAFAMKCGHGFMPYTAVDRFDIGSRSSRALDLFLRGQVRDRRWLREGVDHGRGLGAGCWSRDGSGRRSKRRRRSVSRTASAAAS